MLPRCESSISADGGSTWSCEAAAHMSHAWDIIMITCIDWWWLVVYIIIFSPSVLSKKWKVLMLWWWLQGPCIHIHTGCITILHRMQLLTCMQITVTSNAAKLQLCVFKQNRGSRLCVHTRLITEHTRAQSHICMGRVSDQTWHDRWCKRLARTKASKLNALTRLLFPRFTFL